MEYKSLKDVYTSKVVGWSVPPLPRQKNLCLEQIPAVTPQTPEVSSPQPSTQSFNINTFSTGTWTPIQKRLFNAQRVEGKGEGRGEKSVASMLSGKTKTQELNRYIQGSSQPYDVADIPSMPQAKFEVKEFKFKQGEPGEFKGSVRIGKEGAGTTNRIIAGIKRIFDDVENEYMALDEENRRKIDTAIIATLFPALQPPQAKTGPRSRGVNTVAYIKAKEKYDALVKTLSDWTLEGYINALFDIAVGEERTISELPYSLFKSAWEKPSTQMRTDIRKKYLLFPITQLLLTLERLASSASDENIANPKLTDLQAVLKKHYLPPDNNEYAQKLDKEAEILDRKLTKSKCQLAGKESCKTSEEFFKAIKRLKLSSTFEDINKIRSASADSLFPNINGLFIVHPGGYVYIPKSEINNKIFISQLTQGGLKIQPIPDILRGIAPYSSNV